MSFQDFVKNKQNIPTNTGSVSNTAPSSGSFQDFVNKKNTVISNSVSNENTATSTSADKLSNNPLVPDFIKPKTKDEPKQGVLRWAGAQIEKPVIGVATIMEATRKYSRGDKEAFKSVPADLVGAITGKNTRSFNDILKEDLPNHPKTAAIMGLVMDIGFDPLTYLSGGLTAYGKTVKKASALKKAGVTIKAGSKFSDDLIKAGLKADDAVLGATKVEQALKGERSFLQFAGKPLLSAKQSAAAYKATGKAGVAMKKLPLVGSTIKKSKNLFSTATSNPAFDALKTKMDNLLAYRKDKVFTDAKAIQKTIKGMKPDDIMQVANYLETGTQPNIPVLKQIGDKLKVTYKEFADVEKKLGLLDKEITNYIPHIKTAKGQKAAEILNIKPWTAKLGSSEPRTILRFADESGKGVIGTADDLGLKKVDDVIKNKKVVGSLFKDSKDKIYKVGEGVKPATVSEINKAFNKTMFQENPAVQLAYRGVANAKAVTSKEFFEGAAKFSVKDGIETAIPELKGLKFEPQVAKHLDEYFKALSPDEIKKVFKVFDTVQNWWKGQALISPSYHLRNSISNVWNNFLAGVIDPRLYKDATKVQLGKKFNFVDDIGRKWTSKSIMEEAKKTGVVNKGWYGGDIAETVTSKMGGKNFNPLSQNNALFRGNRAVGSAVENNARLANFIHQLKKGETITDAALQVKKFLFDYGDLTFYEKNVLKRLMPFYTFTRKNVPLQLENLIKQPGKFAGIEKVIQAVENIGMGDDDPANEKYLSDYIKNNTAMRINYNEEDKSYNYFLLGNWLPSYQAMDFLSQPLPNLMAMLTPILKTPIETLTNTSSFWKNSLDEYQDIERYPGEQTNFLGVNMPKKTAQILRNLRLLNDLDKLNPGKIFGGAKGEKSIWAKANLPAANVPVVGNLSPSQYKYTKQGTNPSGLERGLGFVSSKLVPYKPSYSRGFYNQDTEARMTEFKAAIRRAGATGDKARAKLLIEQMKEFQKERGN